MGLLSKLFGDKDKKQKHENTGYRGMWVCPECDIALSTDAVQKLEDLGAWYCCPGCGHEHLNTNYKKEVEKANNNE